MTPERLLYIHRWECAMWLACLACEESRGEPAVEHFYEAMAEYERNNRPAVLPRTAFAALWP